MGLVVAGGGDLDRVQLVVMVVRDVELSLGAFGNG